MSNSNIGGGVTRRSINGSIKSVNTGFSHAVPPFFRVVHGLVGFLDDLVLDWSGKLQRKFIKTEVGPRECKVMQITKAGWKWARDKWGRGSNEKVARPTRICMLTFIKKCQFCSQTCRWRCDFWKRESFFISSISFISWGVASELTIQLYHSICFTWERASGRGRRIQVAKSILGSTSIVVRFLPSEFFATHR